MLISSSARLGTFTFEPKLCLLAYLPSLFCFGFCFLFGCLGDAFECELLGISDKFQEGWDTELSAAVAVIPDMLFMLSVCKQASFLFACFVREMDLMLQQHTTLKSMVLTSLFFFFRFEIVA